MLGDKRFHSVKRKDELDITGLLEPERAIVVEDGNSLCEWHEISSPFF